MLVLSRKPGEEVIIGGDIRVTLVAIRGNRARLGFTVPVETPIWRKELCRLFDSHNRTDPSEAVASGGTCQAGSAEIGR
jgi:carbon storage regulator